MIHLSITVIIEFILGLFLWWTAIYLFTQNPFNRIVQILSALLATVSFYFSCDVFFGAVLSTHQYSLNTVILRLFIPTLYLPSVLFYHASTFLVSAKTRSTWQLITLYLAYFFAGLIVFLEIATNMIRNYPIFSSPSFGGNLAEATGKYFFLIGIFFIFIISAIVIAFYKAMRSQPKYSSNWYKFLWPFWGSTLSALLGPVVLASYYQLIPHSVILPAIDFALLIIPLIYSMIRYSLFLDDAKVIFGRNFLYSTLAIFSILVIYFMIIAFTATPFASISSMILPFCLAYLLIASHPLYDWIITFARDIIYRVPSGYSVVTDDEVLHLLKDINAPEKLEQSSLLRLNVVTLSVKNGHVETTIDALKTLAEKAIEYFKPEKNTDRRLKKNLKYQILKMIAFDEAEEGQILWELGFEDYPVKIMAQARSYREPMFKIESPSDYTYISRNAYLALKKEAIHDVTWRISYLEKRAKRKGSR